ncbi:SHOCT domain-containing protein [Novosphingobium bradum]|uniref:SHOCT domain-containing protein n=1 Tax=Novosphingobium bradum TaxID=1737444 RepID=A0ABV7IPF8_9SPHN
MASITGAVAKLMGPIAGPEQAGIRVAVAAAILVAGAGSAGADELSSQTEGKLLAACIKQAAADNPGPDFTKKYAAVEECQKAHPYTYDKASSAVPPFTEPDQNAMRSAAERYVRSMLVDPDSAKFEWPYGFVNSSWKRLFGKPIVGYITCGKLNSKNRMGGYAGQSWFVVVMDGQSVSFADIGSSSGTGFDLVGGACEKSVTRFPPPTYSDVAHVEGDTGDATKSIVDQLVKLDDLRKDGVITEEEFSRMKATLMGR